MRKTNKIKRKKQKQLVIISTFCLLFILTIGYAAFQTNLNITAKGNVKEKSRVIQSWSNTDVTDFHSTFYKENIVNITFLDNADVPSNATESWNVSEDKTHGAVMAWVVPNNDDNTKYDLYIGAKDGVIANKNSAYLFYGFTNVKSIDFKDTFDTKNVTNMAAMFAHCKNLLYLDLSSFDTSNVITLEDIFTSCISLTSINFNGWNTFKVTNMRGLFFQNYSLTTVDLSNFNTTNVTNMRAMFMEANNLSEIDLCNFDTKNVKSTIDMFSNTPNLKKVKVGSNWTTENADTSNMFTGSGVSSVTTGQC